MRKQQVDLRDNTKGIQAKQEFQTQSVSKKECAVNTLDQVPQIQTENQLSSTFLSDDFQKAIEIINQLKNYSSNSLIGKEIEQKVVLSSDNRQVLDILLVKPGRKAMKRSMKRFLKKRAMQKIIMPNLFNVSQIFMDLLLFQNDCIQKRVSKSVLISDLLRQAESMFLEGKQVEQQLIKREKQEQEITINIKKIIEKLSKPRGQFSFQVQELPKVAGFVIAEKLFMLQKKQQGGFAAKGVKSSKLYEKQSQLHVKERQMQESDMIIKFKKTNEDLIKPQVQFSLSIKEFSKVVEQTIPKKVFMPYDQYQGLFRVEGVKNTKVYENQSKFNDKELCYSKHNTQDNQQLSSENKHNRPMQYQGNYRRQQYNLCLEMIEKVNGQAIIVRKQLQLCQQLSNQEKIQENNQIIKENKFPQNLNDKIVQQEQLKYQQNNKQKTKQSSYIQVGKCKKSVKLTLSKKNSVQQNQLQKDDFIIQQLLQQLNCQKNLKTNLIQIPDLSIAITLTQAQRNNLLNLIKKNKMSQIQTLMTRIISKQCHLFKQNTLVSNMLLSHNNTENKANLSKKINIAQNLYSQYPVKQFQRVNQHIPGFAGNSSKLFNEHKLLGGGCGISKIVIDPNILKEDDQQKLKSDKFFNESKYADESQFRDFIEIYNKYYTNTEINHEVLENRIRTIVEALHKQCEHIFSLTIRSKVIEIINLLINYYMIAIQKNDVQTLQKFIDKTDQELKDLKETCFQNRKKYPCFDLCQYFDLLISLNQQRQGIDKINQNQAIKIAEIILKLVKFGAGFTSIFGAINTLSKIQLDDIQKHFKEMQLVFSKLFESSKEIGQQSLEQYTSYSSGNLSNKIQAIWLRKVQSLGDDLRDEHQQIIFYLKEINEIQNSGNNEIVLFVYMQINYLLQKKQKDDNLNSFTMLLRDTKQENLILDFINYLQFKTYSTTIFENAKKLLDSLITSEQFRQLKISLLLKFSQILENFNDKKQNYHKLMIHLCMTYLQENEISVKIVYKGNQRMKMFIQDIEKYTAEIVNESKQSYQAMKSIIQDEEKLNKIANKIESNEDVAILLAKTYVQMWEASVKQRQEQKQIAHKDDALLEVIQLYIKQKVTHLQGYSLSENLNDKNEDNQLELSDALRLIINQFLIPNFVQPKNEYLTAKQNKSDQQSCKILSILAEGGSGKSMILKKLELELLKDDSEYIKDERAEYIPFIIKCNSLDIKQPSIEEYLLSQNLSQSEIELLKRSERNKLIMLDGYDEYTGNYFKVYETLKINNWVNTLVIVTSRLEKISVSDAKLYFNYYDKQGNQGSQDSYSILKLEKINDSDIKEYLERYKEQQINLPSFNEQKHNQFLEIIFQSKTRQFLEMLKLPINLYLTTRMVADLDLNDKKILTTIQEASDQVEIQELFFQQQFQKLSQNFVEQKLKIPTNNTIERDNKQQELVKTVQSCYFEYFQTIAMLMFLQKGKKANFLSTKKSDISFKLRDEVKKYLKQSQINSEEVIQNVKGYIDSRVVTRIQLSIKEESSQNQSALDALNDETLEFEFRHKSLFEYFTARAMKYDFDLHKETIFKLNSTQLSEFSINKRIIMSSEINASEQQILLKLFKLIKPEIDSPQFKENYYIEDISRTNRYIQFLKKSSISDSAQTSVIDIGSSNLLSTLFISKFSFPNLIFKKCSFSQAYIQKYSLKVVEFQDCNFGNAFLEKQHLEYFETSNTKNVTQTAFQQKFNTDDVVSFNQVIFYKNHLVTITKTGFINSFEIQSNKSQNLKNLLSNQITLSPLNTIHINETKNVLVVTAKKSIFEVNPQTLEKVNSFTFSKEIASLSINKSKYIVTLSSKQILYGNIEDGFKILNKNKIKSTYSLSKNDFIITSQGDQIDIYNLQDLQIIKRNLDSNGILETSTFSADGKYFGTGSKDKTCKIWDTEKGFELINIIQGHTEQISSIAFSADGKYLATGSYDKTCKIWNKEKGFELINTIQGDTSYIKSVAFSADGKYLLTGSEDNTCKTWIVEKGFELINTIQGHTDYIKSVAFSADGKYLATGSRDNTCKIWYLGKGFELINTIQGHTGAIYSVAFSADGKYLATGSDDKTCKIWNLKKGFELINTIQGHTFYISSVAFSADGKYLATGSGDNTCNIWNVEKGFDLINTIKHTGSINSVAFSADGKYLTTGSQDKTCKIWNAENGFELLNTIQAHTGSIYSVTFSADGKYLATGSGDNTCKIWNVLKGFELTNTIQGNAGLVYSVAFSADGKYLTTSSTNKTCKIWNVEKGFELINTIQQHTDTIQQVAFSADGKYLATGSFDKTCKIWNVEIGFELINIFQGHTEAIISVAFSADGKYLSTGSYDNTCKIWNLEKGSELINTIQGHTSYIGSVAFSADGKYLATGSGDKTCKIWNLEKGFDLINTIQHTGSINSLAFSANGKYFAMGSEDNTCKIWNIENGFELINTIQGHTSYISSVAFSADGKYLATSSGDKTCKIWKVEERFELIYTILGHTDSINSLAFSADGKYLATGSDDQTCKIWNLEKGFELLNTIQGHSKPIISVAFSADGKYLATGSQDSTCKILNVEKGFELINTIQGHTGSIYSVAFSADGKYLAIGSLDKICQIWNLEKGFELINTIQGHVNQMLSADFSEDGENKIQQQQILDNKFGEMIGLKMENDNKIMDNYKNNLLKLIESEHIFAQFYEI